MARASAGPARRPTFLRRLAGAMTAAAAGAYAGHLYAVSTLPEDMRRAELVGMYATGGAVIGVILLRFAGILRALWREYRDK
jgi:hypothetical protein